MQSLKYFILIFVMVLLASCGAASTPTPEAEVLAPRLQELKTAGQIVVGTAITRPMEYREAETNRLIGFDIDLLTHIMSSLGIEIVWREMAFADLLPELQAGNVDMVIAGMYITTAREDIVDLSQAYLETGLVMGSNVSNAETINLLQDLAGRTLGVKEGSTGERFAEQVRTEGFNGSEPIAMELQRYTDTIDSLDDLDEGLIDAVLNDYINTLEYIKTHPNVRVAGEILQPAGFGMAVQSGDTDLLNFLNTGIDQARTSGKLEELFNQWINPETAR